MVPDELLPRMRYWLPKDLQSPARLARESTIPVAPPRWPSDMRDCTLAQHWQPTSPFVVHEGSV